MRYHIERLPMTIPMGVQSENNAEAVEFDVSDWLTRDGSLSFSVWVTRPGETEAYQAANATLKDGVLYWWPTGADTAIAGEGRVEILAVSAKRRMLSGWTATTIRETTTETTTDAPVDQRPWLDQALLASEEAKAAAASAAASADQAEGVVKKEVAALTKEIAGLGIVSKNRFDKTDPEIVKGQIIGSDGQWIPEQDFCESGYIPCVRGDVIRYSHWRDGQRFDMNAMWIAFFDGNKNFVNSAIYGDDLAAIAPCDGYCRTSFYAARYDTTMVTINMEMPDEYEPYFAIRKTIDALAQNAEMSGGLQWKGKKWYAYGTSLTSAEIGKYVPYVEALSGLVATNKGIGGGALVANRNIYNALMDNTDGKADADLITIEVGANDYSSPLGDISSMDTNTFCGALNTCLQNVLKNCPKAQVILMCSTRQPTNDDGLTLSALDGKNPHGVTYEERDEAIRRVASANGIYYIPFGSGLGMGLFRMQSSGIYNVDHIHHTDLGGYNLAQGVWGYLRNIPLWYNALPNN